MKILIFTNMYPTKEKPQFGIYVYNQVKILEEMGCRCKVISLKTRGNKYFRYLSFFLRALYYALLKGEEYSVVHAHYAFPPGLFALLHKKRFHSKMIVTAHGSDINKMPDKSSKIAFVMKKILEYADSIVCVSDSLKENIIKRFGVDDKKIKIINMGIDTKTFYKIDHAKKELNLPYHKKIILFVGNFYKMKGVLDLVDAFQKMSYKNAILILVGDSTVEEETRRILKEKAKDDKRIMLIDPQPQKIIAKYMSAADVFVLPSYSEGYSLVTYEAMATESLVVVNDLDVFKYLKEDTVIKAETGNIESLTIAIEKSLDVKHKSLYTTNGLEIALKNSAQEKATEIFKIYNE